MKILGPFNYHHFLCIVAFQKDTLTIIKLGFKSSIIYALNNQLSFFHSNHFEKLFNSSMEKLKNNYRTESFSKRDINALEIQRSKAWAHKLLIQLDEKNIKLTLQERPKVEEYEQIICEWIK